MQQIMEHQHLHGPEQIRLYMPDMQGNYKGGHGRTEIHQEERLRAKCVPIKKKPLRGAKEITQSDYNTGGMEMKYKVGDVVKIVSEKNKKYECSGHDGQIFRQDHEDNKD